MDTIEVEEFAKKHPVGFCKMPDGLSSLPMLSASRQFMAPSQIDHRDYFLKTDDQGNKPWCAAYAAAQITEAIHWQVSDCPNEVDPTPIYAYAKQIDGDPNGDGTTLTAVLEAVKHLGYFGDSCKVQVIRPNRLAVKYAIHRFGCCLGGFNISRQWYSCNKNNHLIDDSQEYVGIGGHAVAICGYNREGVWFQNSWSKDFGEWGFGKMTWSRFDKEFMYGACLTNVYDGMKL